MDPGIPVTDEAVFAAHLGGKLSVQSRVPLDTQHALSVVYTPGVAEVSRAIAADPTLAARYTWAHRLVAVISDGSAVLGLGDIGPAAALPVMEGKSLLWHEAFDRPHWRDKQPFLAIKSWSEVMAQALATK